MRRHLNYTPAEVDAMGVSERRMWMEMLNIEFNRDPDADDEDGPYEQEEVSAEAFGLNIERHE